MWKSPQRQINIQRNLPFSSFFLKSFGGKFHMLSCHILNKVKVLVAQLRLTLCDSMDCSLPGPSVHGILQARILENWRAQSFPTQVDLPNPRITPRCPALYADLLPSKPQGKLKWQNFPGGSVLKNLPGKCRKWLLTPVNPMDRGVWWAKVHGAARTGHDLATKPPPPQIDACRLPL